MDAPSPETAAAIVERLRQGAKGMAGTVAVSSQFKPIEQKQRRKKKLRKTRQVKARQNTEGLRVLGVRNS